MPSLRADVRDWAADTARMALKLLVVVGLGLLAGRVVTEQFPPQRVVLALALFYGAVLAFQAGRGYERA